MGPEFFAFLALGSAAIGMAVVKPRDTNNSRGTEIYSGRCRAPMWALLNCLETLVNVRMPSSQYPLSRYWLEMQEVDYRRGVVSATLEFVEEVRRPKMLGVSTGTPRAKIKKYGFIWYFEELLVANQIELVLTLVWKDLSANSRRPSRYQELVLHTMAVLTREIVFKLDQSVVSGGPTPLTTPPPVESGKRAPKTGAPPLSSAAAAAAAAASTNSMNASNVVGAAYGSQQSSALRSSLGGQRHKNNKIAFSDMMKSRTSSHSEEQTTRIIEWPAPQDFHEAVQNPSSCFDDKFLRHGAVATDALGMPKVASGAFASVYRIHCLDRDRALRCFLQPVKDQEFRYQILSKTLSQENLPWTVDFDYLSRGICVGGKWYPVLTMDWVEGTPLNFYVADLCTREDVAGIENLRQEFKEMAKGMHLAGVAHGDLQHGNILVRKGKLVLVDYDGMYVPDLNQQQSNELGHANYQHPSRTSRHFDEYIDHFSCWVIDTAMLCLREDPSLWRYCYDDGESLLFHRQDFIRPESSPLLTHLVQHKSALVRGRANSFVQLLRLDLPQIPPLVAVEKSASAGAARTEHRAPAAENSELPEAPIHVQSSTTSTVTPLSSMPPDSAASHRPLRQETPLPESESKQSSNLPDWLADVD